MCLNRNQKDIFTIIRQTQMSKYEGKHNQFQNINKKPLKNTSTPAIQLPKKN